MIRVINVDPDLYGVNVTYWAKVYGHDDVLLWEGPIDGILNDAHNFNMQPPEFELQKIFAEQRIQYMELEPSWKIITKEEIDQLKIAEDETTESIKLAE